MKFSVFFKITFILMFVTSCAGSVDPSKLKLQANEDRGIVMMKVTASSRDYNIYISKYNDEEEKLETSTFSQAGNFEINSAVKTGYIAKKVRPGKYAFQEFLAQGFWSVCFHENSLSFDVKPGEITYVGEFDVISHYKELSLNVSRAGDARKGGSGRNTYFENISTPKLTSYAQNNADLAEVKKFISENMPNVNAEISIARFENAKFKTGKTITGGRLCNGL